LSIELGYNELWCESLIVIVQLTWEPIDYLVKGDSFEVAEGWKE
jgi:hypothetical protein